MRESGTSNFPCGCFALPHTSLCRTLSKVTHIPRIYSLFPVHRYPCQSLRGIDINIRVKPWHGGMSTLTAKIKRKIGILQVCNYAFIYAKVYSFMIRSAYMWLFLLNLQFQKRDQSYKIYKVLSWYGAKKIKLIVLAFKLGPYLAHFYKSLWIRCVFIFLLLIVEDKLRLDLWMVNSTLVPFPTCSSFHPCQPWSYLWCVCAWSWLQLFDGHLYWSKCMPLGRRHVWKHVANYSCA